VTTAELMERVLPREFDAPIRKLCVDHLDRTGVRVVIGEKVLEILGDTRVTGVPTNQRSVWPKPGAWRAVRWAAS